MVRSFVTTTHCVLFRSGMKQGLNAALGPYRSRIFAGVRLRGSRGSVILRSTADWLTRLVDVKDAELRKLHGEFRVLNNEFRDRLEEKNNELLERLEEIGDLKANNVKLSSDLKVANEKLLGVLGKRNLRGAVEYIAASHLTTAANQNAGVQPKLDSLERQKPFLDMLDSIGKAQNLRRQDMISCLKKLYHVLSKDMHGSSQELVISSADGFAPGEVAVLVALFELFSIPYEVRDQHGNVVQYQTQPQANP